MALTILYINIEHFYNFSIVMKSLFIIIILMCYIFYLFYNILVGYLLCYIEDIGNLVDKVC